MAILDFETSTVKVGNKTYDESYRPRNPTLEYSYNAKQNV